jgi:hypothetical protein
MRSGVVPVCFKEKTGGNLVAMVHSSKFLERVDYIFRKAGRWVALIVAFLSIWFSCIALGFIIPMNTLDHGDVASAAGATIFSALGAIVGPIVALFVIRAIRDAEI